MYRDNCRLINTKNRTVLCTVLFSVLLIVSQIAIAREQANYKVHPGSTNAASPRLTSLHPALTENLFSLNLGPFVVGTTTFSDFPPEAKKIPRVGDNHASPEKILALKPTHILAINQDFGITTKMANQLNIKRIQIPLEKLEDFEPMMRTLGQEFKKNTEAQTRISQWKTAWAQLKPKQNKLKTLIQVQIQPVVSVGRETFLNSILEKCGATNILTDPGYPTLNRESLVKLKPDQVVLLLTDLDLSTRSDVVKSWKQLSPGTKVLFFDPDAISKITTRLPGEAKKFCEALP